jgi:hypothetical protein
VIVELPTFSGPVLAANAGKEAGALAANAYWIRPEISDLRRAIALSETTDVFLAGPLGFDTSPSWQTDPTVCGTPAAPCAIETAGAFWGALARLAAEPATPTTAGFRLLVPVEGVPAPRPGQASGAFCELMNAAAQVASQQDGSGVFVPANDLGWWWRGETASLAKDETSAAFGYRELDRECPLFSPYVVETSARGGWASLGSGAAWLDWLAFFDGEVREEASGTELQGAVVFGVGDAAGADDLSPLATQLAAYLLDPPAPGGGSSGGVAPFPGGGGAGDPGAGDGGGGCGHAGGGLALLVLAPFALRALRLRSRE